MQVLKVSLVVLLVVQQCLSLNILAALSKGEGAFKNEIVNDVSDVSHPLIQVGLTTVTSQCSLVKNILKLDFNSTSEDRAPDVDRLPLVYTTPDIQVSFPLHSAITELPRILGADPSNITLKIFVHGFTDSPSKKNFQAVNDAYRSVGVDAILALDASPLIAYCYLCSSTNVHHIGDKLGEVLAKLYNAGMPAENIHLLGHSLGSHICGFAGKKFTVLTGVKVGRITGLDPAGPCFVKEKELRLKSTDAEFVDVIHSNAAVFGINEQVGHVDFYPNGGAQQPNCLLEPCSHSFSVSLFVETILNPHSLPAVACSSYDEFIEGKCKSDVTNYMGEAAVPSNESQFYLQTNGVSPLAKGPDGMTYVNDDGIVGNLQNSIRHLFSG